MSMLEITRRQGIDDKLPLAAVSDHRDWSVELGECAEQGNSDLPLMDAVGYAVSGDGRNVIAILADGMGSTTGGDVASKLAVSIVKEYFQTTGYALPPQQCIATAIDTANQAILTAPKYGLGCEGMSTTIVLGIVQGRQFTWGYAGDSRALLFRRNCVRRLTLDHLAAVVDRNASDVNLKSLARSDSEIAIARYHYLGDSKVIADYGSIELSPGDRVVLASDGVTEFLTEQAIWRIIAKRRPVAAARGLVRSAIQNKSHDHCSAIVIRIGDHERQGLVRRIFSRLRRPS